MSRFHLKRNFLWLKRWVSERKFSGGSEEVTSHLYQTYPDRSQPSSDVFCPQEDLRTQLRKMEAGASDKDKVEAPTGIMEMCSIFYCTDKCEKRKRTIARFVSCVSWIRIELSRCIHIFLQCITSGAKMLRVPFLVEWTLMKVARHDTITKISGLVGNPCVCQWYQDLPPSVNMAGPIRFGNKKCQRKGTIFKR
jgi:hypothetical protein